MSSFFPQEPSRQPSPADRLPAWIRSKPVWFWVVVFLAIWIVAAIVRMVFFERSGRGRDAEAELRRKQQQQQTAVESANPDAGDNLPVTEPAK